jgi:hypothetical protein
MPEGSSVLWIYAGGAIIIAILWVMTILAVYENLRKDKIEDPVRLLWLGLVVLLPVFGFFLYLSIGRLKRFLQFRKKVTNPTEEMHQPLSTVKRSNRETQETIPQPDKPDSLVFTTGKILSIPRKNGKHAQPVLQNSSIVIPATPRPFVATYSLVVLEGSQTGQEFFLNHFPVTIGRGSEAIIRLDSDLRVSRKHAEIYLWEGTLFLRDLQSTGGTQLNGSPLTEDEMLRVGDRIKIGETVLLLQGVA